MPLADALVVSAESKVMSETIVKNANTKYKKHTKNIHTRPIVIKHGKIVIQLNSFCFWTPIFSYLLSHRVFLLVVPAKLTKATAIRPYSITWLQQQNYKTNVNSVQFFNLYYFVFLDYKLIMYIAILVRVSLEVCWNGSQLSHSFPFTEVSVPFQSNSHASKHLFPLPLFSYITFPFPPIPIPVPNYLILTTM